MQKAFTLPIVLALILLLPVAVLAQEAIVTTSAPIFLLPDAGRVPLRTAAPNTRLRVLEEQPDGWVKVEFRDPQFGMRTGFIEARYLKILRPELEPVDLSIDRKPAAAPEKPTTPEDTPEQAAAAPRRFARGWVDVNFGFAAARESRYGSVFEGELFRETASFTVDYRSPGGAEFDFGGGVMLTPAFGLGISFAGTAHQDNAQLGIRIPHPFFANAFASDSAPTENKLMRSEGSANIQAIFVHHISDRVTARVFGGPSYFRIRQDAVSDIVYSHDFLILLPVHEVDIRRYETETIDFDDGGGWGFHVGGDVSVFFTRVVGVGWFGRFSSGSVNVFDPFSEEDREFKTGGFQSGGGLRLRF